MKILAIDRHYYPDANPYARILRTIAEHLAAAGHEVTVYTAQPSYNDLRREKQPSQEVLGGVNVRRITLLPERKKIRFLWGLNSFYFLLRAWWFAFRNRDLDLVMGATSLPVLVSLTLRFIQLTTGLRYVIHAQDVHPEAPAATGVISKGPFYWLLRELDTHAHRHAWRIVAISRDQRDSLMARGLPHDQIELIHNAPLDMESAACNKAQLGGDDANRHFQVLFAGNIGQFQGLEPAIEAADALRDHPSIRFVFLGTGTEKSKLMHAARGLLGQNVMFLPHMSLETTFAAMQQSQLGLISLAPGIYRYSFPSKTMMYLAAGCPLLAVVESESELARLVKSHRLGVTAAQNSGDIVNAILAAYANRRELDAQRRRYLRDTGERLFGRQLMLTAWEHLLNEQDPVAELRRAA